MQYTERYEIRRTYQDEESVHVIDNSEAVAIAEFNARTKMMKSGEVFELVRVSDVVLASAAKA